MQEARVHLGCGVLFVGLSPPPPFTSHHLESVAYFPLKSSSAFDIQFEKSTRLVFFFILQFPLFVCVSAINPGICSYAKRRK